MSETQDSTQQKNLSLWSQLEATDPAFVRSFNGSDGFHGSGITPIYLVKKATACFGPVGIGWGYDIVHEEYVKGAPLGFDGAGNMYGHVLSHTIRLKFWYVNPNNKQERGEVEQFGGTIFVGQGQHGIYTDEDAPKKSLTDALGKCMSLVGISADVYMGLFDDHKYVAAMEQRFKDKSKTGTPFLTSVRPDAVQHVPDDTAPKATSVANVTSRTTVSSNDADTGGKAQDPAAWIKRVETFTDDGQLAHAHKEAGKFFKGESLLKVRTAIEIRQFSVWLAKVPLVSKSNLPKLREKAPTVFSGEKLGLIIDALDAREASFAAMKPVGAAAA